MQSSRFSVFFTAAICLIISILSTSASAVAIRKIVVFGDSMSDNGNLYQMLATASSAQKKMCDYLHIACDKPVPVVPQTPPYFAGRFSNGPVWVEVLADRLNLSNHVRNYAYAGAWAEDNGNKVGGVVPDDLGTQVDSYLRLYLIEKNFVDHYLFVIWSGANDYLSGRDNVEAATANTVAAIHDQIEKLVSYGAKIILINNLPDAGMTPSSITLGKKFSANVSELINLHNKKLSVMLAKEQRDHKAVKFITGDVMSYFNDVIANPSKYSFRNTHEACFRGTYTGSKSDILDLAMLPYQDNIDMKEAYNTAKSASAGIQPCNNPDDFLYWDHVHPTKAAHALLGNYIFDVLSANDVY